MPELKGQFPNLTTHGVKYYLNGNGVAAIGCKYSGTEDLLNVQKAAPLSICTTLLTTDCRARKFGSLNDVKKKEVQLMDIWGKTRGTHPGGSFAATTQRSTDELCHR